MTINKIIRELLSMPRSERAKEFDFGRKVRFKTKNGHELIVEFSKEFYEPGMLEIEAQPIKKKLAPPF